MDGFCCTLLSMSLAAALTALGVMVARLFLYKLPRALICGLWLVVLFRMACPVSVSLPVGLVPQGVADDRPVRALLLPPSAERGTGCPAHQRDAGGDANRARPGKLPQRNGRCGDPPLACDRLRRLGGGGGCGCALGRGDVLPPAKAH